MATKTLAAIAAVIISTAAQANGITWRDDGRWKVWQDEVNNEPVCYLSTSTSTTQGAATFGWAQNAARNGLMIVYREPNWRWLFQTGTMTVRIDGYAPHSAAMRALNGSDSGTAFAMIGNNASAGTFINEFVGGQMLYVTSGSGTRSFSLAGSTAAMTTLVNCVHTIDGSQSQQPHQRIQPLAPATPWRGV